jgi:hypothetical protein
LFSLPDNGKRKVVIMKDAKEEKEHLIKQLEDSKNKEVIRNSTKTSAELNIINKLLPVLTAIIGVIIGALLNYHLGIRAQVDLIRSQKQYEIFIEFSKLKHDVESDFCHLKNIEMEYKLGEIQRPFENRTGEDKAYIYSHMLALRNEYFILNQKVNELFSNFKRSYCMVQTLFSNVPPQLLDRLDSIMLNLPEIAYPPDDPKKNDTWRENEKGKLDLFFKNEFRPITNSILINMGKEIYIEVETTSLRNDTT